MKVDRIVGLVSLCLALLPLTPALANGLGPPEMVAASEVQERVNINEADAETLERVLVGVGRSRAEAIVAYREEHGKFYAPEELTAVKGIGEATVRRNLARILVE